MNIIITGGRNSTDRAAVWDFLDQLMSFISWRGDPLAPMLHGDDLTIAQGGATGVDKFAREWCMKRGVNFKNYPYPKHLGRAGGPVRNRDMAVKEKPTFVVAFAGGKGTRSMMKIAGEMGIPVILAGQEPEQEQKWQPRCVQPEGL